MTAACLALLPAAACGNPSTKYLVPFLRSLHLGGEYRGAPDFFLVFLRCSLKRYLIATAAVAVLAAACSGGGEVAATVTGAEIISTDVDTLFYDGGEGLPEADFSQFLSTLIQWKAIAAAGEADFGIDPTTDEIATEVDRLYAEQGAGATYEEFLESQNISEGGLEQYAAQLLIGAAILDELQATVDQPTAADAEDALAADPAVWTTEVCSAHILVATAEEATDVLTRLDAGEDFEALATELSLDTGSGAAGGALGCISPATYVLEFAEAAVTAEIGEVSDPVESQFGFHLIRVDSRTLATTDIVITGLYDQRVAQAVDAWYTGSVNGAEITLDEAYGTWVTDPFPTIVAPES